MAMTIIKKMKHLFDNPEGLNSALDLWTELLDAAFVGGNHFFSSSFTDKGMSSKQQEISDKTL